MRKQLARTALVGATALLAIAPSGLASAASGPSVPTDARAHGFVALCGPDGNPVTGGSLDTTPFVWTAISSQPPSAAYTGPGRNADLTIYQERPGVDPADWSGDQLTADTRYADPAYPTAQATRKDISLRVITHEFPPEGRGLYQLRMNYGRLGYGIDPGAYAASTIAVTGDTWHVVAGGTIACSHGRGTSSEVTLGVTQAEPAPSYAAEVASAQHRAGGPVAAATPPAAAGGTRSAHPDETVIGPRADTNTAAATTATAGHRGGGSFPAAALAGIGAALFVGAGGLLWRLRRRSP